MLRLLISISLALSLIEQPVECSYKYFGCYSRVFLNDYYWSSYMEPTLCFRLCDTPLIYIRKQVCRCSGPGLTHTSRRDHNDCQISCPSPVDRSVTGRHTCGGESAYSVYVQNDFYIRHGHLFQYDIKFTSCELWKSPLTDVVKVEYNLTIRSSLNRLERCAAVCLDQNATTISVGFNSNKGECYCILAKQQLNILERITKIVKLPNDTCDSLCHDNFGTSANLNGFHCGSTSNSNIVAIYTLNGSCLSGFHYVKELKKCIRPHKAYWGCPSSSYSYVYGGEVTWNVFLEIISKLGLNDTTVNIDFRNDITVQRSWKCDTSNTYPWRTTTDRWGSYFSSTRASYYRSRSNISYVLNNGCIRETLSTYSLMYFYRLCAVNPFNRDLPDDGDDDDSTYVASVNPNIDYCPPYWFDLNGRCYRMSDKKKSIKSAQHACIDDNDKNPFKDSQRGITWMTESKDSALKENSVNTVTQGKLVQYTSEWQARLGFFLLHTTPAVEADHTSSSYETTSKAFYYDEDHDIVDSSNNTLANSTEFTNEFHLGIVPENANFTVNNNSCAFVTRNVAEQNERPTINVDFTRNCSTPKYVLCETDTLIVKNYHMACLQKPITLGVPALISNLMTHEFCLSICQELQTKFAIVKNDKCFCINDGRGNTLNITIDFEKYRRSTCGKPCPGNQNELCGNENTIVVFQILDSRRTFSLIRTPAEAYPDFTYDSCLLLKTFNQASTYQFMLKAPESAHPRYCLALCEKFQQKYALINNGECLCTNSPIKQRDDDIEILKGQNCSQPCNASYFYSCGSTVKTMIYSLYVMQPKCRHGFDVAENDQQCVYAHFSNKKKTVEQAGDFCQGINGQLAKIKDIIEIQDILPDSILHTRLMQQLQLLYHFKFINDTRYYWINRTDGNPHTNTISARSLKECQNQPESADPNCVSITYARASSNGVSQLERCISKSSQCSTESAMPVCVDKSIETATTTDVPQLKDDQSEIVNTIVAVDYTCSENNSKSEYHLIDDYCYKILPNEMSWNDGKSACERDGAILFVPEKSVSLQHIKLLYHRLQTYSSSSTVHVGVFYDQGNDTVYQYDAIDTDKNVAVPDSNAIYDFCEKSFLSRLAVLTLSGMSETEKVRMRNQQSGCGYIYIEMSTVSIIRCDEIPCNQTASVICQKSPLFVHQTVEAERRLINVPSPGDLTTTVAVPSDSIESKSSTTPESNEDESDNSTLTTESDSSDDLSSTTLSDSTDDLTNTSLTQATPGSTSSTTIESTIIRDFAPLFFFLIIFLLFILFVSLHIFFNLKLNSWRPAFYRRTSSRPTNSLYSQLHHDGDLDLN